MNHQKLYSQLTTDERFALTIEAMARMDLVEVDRLQGAMEQLTYRMTDAGYWRRLQMLMTLSLRHAYMRMETTAHLLLALLLITLFEGEKDTDDLAQGASKLMGKLNVMDETWEEFCRSLNIDSETAFQSAQIKPKSDIDDLITEVFSNTDEITIEVDENLRKQFKTFYTELWGKAASKGH